MDVRVTVAFIVKERVTLIQHFKFNFKDSCDNQRSTGE